MPYDTRIGSVDHKKDSIDQNNDDIQRNNIQSTDENYRKTVNNNAGNQTSDRHYKNINRKNNPTRQVTYILEFFVENTAL